MNSSLGQMIRSQIIASAKEMLLTGESIKEVAYAMGFEELNNFSSFFQHHVGVSPSQFKK